LNRLSFALPPSQCLCDASRLGRFVSELDTPVHLDALQQQVNGRLFVACHTRYTRRAREGLKGKGRAGKPAANMRPDKAIRAPWSLGLAAMAACSWAGDAPAAAEDAAENTWSCAMADAT